MILGHDKTADHVLHSGVEDDCGDIVNTRIRFHNNRLFIKHRRNFTNLGNRSIAEQLNRIGSAEIFYVGMSLNKRIRHHALIDHWKCV